jgi:hypothetical protein
VLAVLGAVHGAAEESTFRRAFALASPDVLDRVLGAWLWTKAVRAGGRLLIAIDGKTVKANMPTLYKQLKKLSLRAVAMRVANAAAGSSPCSSAIRTTMTPSALSHSGW